MDKIILWFLNFMTLYAFIPGLLSRLFGYRVFKKGVAKREIALTFDDGPDETYTEKLLDLLQQYNAKATFFVVGANAAAYPHIITRIKDEGHTLGIHNYHHKINWFMMPRTVKKQIEQTNETIFSITGEYTSYYRPPWGVINLFDFARVKEYNIVLWSSIFGDWQKKLGAERLKAKMLKKLSPGAVFVLHDSGKTLGADLDAPQNMLVALKDILEVGQQKGYTFVTIDKLQSLSESNRHMHPTLLKSLAVKGWLAYEGLVHHVLRLKAVKGSNVAFFHYRRVKYSGKQLHLNDGTVVSKGDEVIELHFDNKQLSTIAFQSKSMLSTAVRLIKETERNLPYLAEVVLLDPQYNGVKAVVGLTMINRGADRLGFEIFPMEAGFNASVTRRYLKLLMRALTPTKQKDKPKSRHDEKMDDNEPRHVVLNRTTLNMINEQHQQVKIAKAEVAVSNNA